MPRHTYKHKRYSREVMGHILKHESLQVGGGVITGNGIRYDYRTNRNSDGIWVFRGRRQRGGPDCFLLFLNRDRTATLQSLKQAAYCALDPNGTGKTMVRAVVNLARERGATRISLMDDSKKHLPNGKSFRLSNMYFLTIGQTWYELLIPGLKPEEKADLVAHWRQRALTNTWEEVANRLGPIPIPVDITDIDVSQPGSAMVVLRRIKDAETDFFADYDDAVLIASNIGNLYGLAWEAPL